MINVTKTFLPDFDKYVQTLKRAWDKNWITNNGELVLELEEKLREFVGNDKLLFCNNGTIVLQMAIKGLALKGEIITTPFSYVATTSAILWEGCVPVFVDIEPDSFCIDADKIEQEITSETKAILATHVYGYPCNIEKISEIARKYNLKVIYDAAHAFGCTYKGKSLLDYGDISTCSFHATKIFHTVEGGCIISQDSELNRKLYLIRQFGHYKDDHFVLGINAKVSEFHAAMGLCILPEMDAIIEERKAISGWYDKYLDLAKVQRPKSAENFGYNYSYYPVVVSSEDTLKEIMSTLEAKDIFLRRYFYPSLNTLPYLNKQSSCPISEDISVRVLSLPLFNGLAEENVKFVCQTINSII